MIRAVLVDDEPPARRKLRYLLSDEPDFEVAGEAESARQAIDVLNAVRPDLVFLDIGLPDASGFDVVSSLSNPAGIQIVFTTAYDEFALRAFEVHALDYLLKPIEPSRFSQVLPRIRALVRSKPLTPRRLLIQDGSRSLFIDMDAIDWIGWARNYACIHTGGKTHIQRSTLEALAAKLDPTLFRRINRSEIINVNCMQEEKSGAHGDSRVILRDGTELTWSRRYRN